MAQPPSAVLPLPLHSIPDWRRFQQDHPRVIPGWRRFQRLTFIWRRVEQGSCGTAASGGGFWGCLFRLIASCQLLAAKFSKNHQRSHLRNARAYARRKDQFSELLGKLLPVCILRENRPTKKGRNRSCSSSRAERKRLAKILCNFPAVQRPSPLENAGLQTSLPAILCCTHHRRCHFRGSFREAESSHFAGVSAPEPAGEILRG